MSARAGLDETGRPAREPTGMGVRFVELDDQSRRHIAQLVAAHEQEGGRPFEIEPAEPAPEGPAPGAAEEPGAPERDPAGTDSSTPAVQRDTATSSPPPAAVPAVPLVGRVMSAVPGRRRYLLWVLMAFALLAATTIALWPPGTPAPRPATEDPALAAPPPAPSGSDAPTIAEPAAKPAQLQLVDDWSRAWSEQRVEAYFEAYSPRFTPPQGLDRAAGSASGARGSWPHSGSSWIWR